MDSFPHHFKEKHLLTPKVKMNLKLKMILLIGALISLTFIIMGVFLHYFFSDTIETQLGERALSVATSISLIPEIQEAFALDVPAAVIQPIVKPIQEETGAEFIVVGNTHEIRYAHPDKEKIGLKMVGEDNAPALLHGESYISKATGSLGYSIRGKVPVYSEQEIVGVVSVGYLVNDVQSMVLTYSKELWYVLLFMITLGIIGAVLIAHYIKKLLFGLEPEEISHLLLQKETILQSTHEGIIAVNQEGKVTLANHAALKLLTDRHSAPLSPLESPVGRPIQEVLPMSALPQVLHSGESQYDQQMYVGAHTVLVNRVPIFYEKTLIGAVSTFRNKTEIDQLTKELTQAKQYADALRAQTHEFSNKLFTILGLLQLERKDEAISFIQKENNIQQDWIHSVLEKVTDPMVGAILLGKLNQAMEQRVNMVIEEGSQLMHPLEEPQQEALVTALGNLLENAIDAAKTNPKLQQVSIFFTDLGEDLVFEIEDSGPGIPMDLANSIFTRGFSTKKGEHRGFGLALVKEVLAEVNGQIYIEEGDLGGACFVITIPRIKLL
ncbi:ATP-binding protein [Alkalihalophilus marmarensis]|uniref:histidine kinase n=1 Tax=Alkalihalophilus marmarensis DSM 21297 TaxID=1188261 RepID=U6SLC9_9BACI|nr:sensor histidine kinase [Alkalihalophilus marmarensis]ERN51730.1 sensor histidine kinase [Alkalihalophilus marmarensis DSM 21297]